MLVLGGRVGGRDTMSKDGFWSGLRSAVWGYYLLKFLPILVLIGIVVYALVTTQHSGVIEKYGNDPDVIVTSRVESTVRDYARKDLDKELFTKVGCIEETKDRYHAGVYYYFSDNKKSAKEFEELIKSEATRLFDIIKDKSFKSDSLLSDSTTEYTLRLRFYIPNKDGSNSTLAVTDYVYSISKGFDQNKSMANIRKISVTDEELKKVIDHQIRGDEFNAN